MVTWTLAEPSRLPHAAPLPLNTGLTSLCCHMATMKPHVSEDVTEPGVQELGTSLCLMPGSSSAVTSHHPICICR